MVIRMYYFPFIIFIICIFSCKEGQKLKEVAFDEALFIIKEEIKSNNYRGPTSKKLLELINSNQSLKLFRTSDNAIVYDSISALNYEQDRLLYICLLVFENPPKVERIEINCEEADSLISKMLEQDNDVRNYGGDMDLTTKNNQTLLTNLIEQCGWAENYEKGIWLLLQHSDWEYKAYHFPDVLKKVNEKKLVNAHLAYYIDRLLVGKKFKQVYGTQITSDRHFYPIVDIEAINERRSKMNVDFGDIENYSERLGIDWAMELIRHQANE
jgi:hypothetical protein